VNSKKAKALRKEAKKLFGDNKKIYQQLRSGQIVSTGSRQIYQETKVRIKRGEL
jgi:hypothetical protein